MPSPKIYGFKITTTTTSSTTEGVQDDQGTQQVPPAKLGGFEEGGYYLNFRYDIIHLDGVALVRVPPFESF